MSTASIPRSATGIPGFDDVLAGGFLPGRLYLVDGNPGAGKTTLAMQYLLEGVRLGERCMYITLSETPDELRAGAASHGWTLDDIEIVELSAHSDLHGDDELTLFHPSEVELSETTRRVLEHVQRADPERLVFDSLSEMRLLARTSLRYRRQVLALKQFFAGRQCTVLMLDDRTAEGAGPAAPEHRAWRGVARTSGAALRPRVAPDAGGEVPWQRLPQRLPPYRPWPNRRGGLSPARGS